jgi:transposase InsO family protein
MKNGTQTRVKYLLPYREKWRYLIGNPPKEISKKAMQRLKWVDYIIAGNNVLKASRHFDIPEPTIRYWYKRFDTWDLSSLEDQSRRANSTRRTPVTLEQAQRVIDLRTGKYKGWGKVKIQRKLKEEGICIGQSRIQKIINEAGLKRIPASKKKYYKRRNRRHMYAVKKEVREQSGGLVYLDVKHLYLPGGQRVYQFTAIDHATRMMRVKLFTRITSRCGKMFLDYLQEEYPFERIQYIGTDNGSEFLGELDEELEKRKIIHLFSSPASPKQNPFVERSIRTVIDEVYYYKGTEITMKEQQEVLDEYVHIYNHERPHWSLELRTPVEQFNLLQSNTLNS